MQSIYRRVILFHGTFLALIKSSSLRLWLLGHLGSRHAPLFCFTICIFFFFLMISPLELCWWLSTYIRFFATPRTFHSCDTDRVRADSRFYNFSQCICTHVLISSWAGQRTIDGHLFNQTMKLCPRLFSSRLVSFFPTVRDIGLTEYF